MANHWIYTPDKRDRVKVIKRRIGGNLHTLPWVMWVERGQEVDGDVYEDGEAVYKVERGEHVRINLAIHSLARAPQVRRRDDMVMRW